MTKSPRWSLHLTVTAILMSLSASAHAQEVAPKEDNPLGVALSGMLDQACSIADLPPSDTIGKDSTAIFVDVSGSVLRMPTQAPDERASVRLVVVGPTAGLRRVIAHQASPTRDEDEIRLIGTEGGTVAAEAAPPKCASRIFPFSNFAGPEGRVKLSLVGNGFAPTEVATVRFPVRRLYRGAISFGPYLSTIADRSFAAVPEADGESAGSILVEGGGSMRTLYAMTFTAFLGQPDPRFSGVRWGWFLGVPIQDVGDHAMTGLAFDFGGGVLLAHLGLHVGRQSQLLNPGLSLDDPTGGVDPVTEKALKAGATIGFTLDARAAGAAFGKIFTAVAGS